MKSGLYKDPVEWFGPLTCTRCGCVFKTKLSNLHAHSDGMGSHERCVSCPTKGCNSCVSI